MNTGSLINSKQSLLVLLHLLLVARGDHGGSRDDTEHTEGYASVEAGPAWFLGGGGRSLGLFAGKSDVPPLDRARVTDHFLEIVAEAIDHILDHWANLVLEGVLKLTVQVLVPGLELISNCFGC